MQAAQEPAADSRSPASFLSSRERPGGEEAKSERFFRSQSQERLWFHSTFSWAWRERKSNKAIVWQQMVSKISWENVFWGWKEKLQLCLRWGYHDSHLPGKTLFSSLKSCIQGKINSKELFHTIHLSQHEHVSESTGIKAKKSLSPVTVQNQLGGAGDGNADTGLHNGHYRARPRVMTLAEDSQPSHRSPGGGNCWVDMNPHHKCHQEIVTNYGSVSQTSANTYWHLVPPCTMHWVRQNTTSVVFIRKHQTNSNWKTFYKITGQDSSTILRSWTIKKDWGTATDWRR